MGIDGTNFFLPGLFRQIKNPGFGGADGTLIVFNKKLYMNIIIKY